MPTALSCCNMAGMATALQTIGGIFALAGMIYLQYRKGQMDE
jgi:hypothetical protein